MGAVGRESGVSRALVSVVGGVCKGMRDERGRGKGCTATAGGRSDAREQRVGTEAGEGTEARYFGYVGSVRDEEET